MIKQPNLITEIKRSKKLMGLTESMESKISDWKNNISDFGKVLGVLISEDNETKNKLYLFVGFTPMTGKLANYYEYSYSFMLLDKNDKPITNYLTSRKEVKQYLPKDLIGNRSIFPIIKIITRKLLDNNMSIENIFRKTEEKLSGDSLKRYEEITNIMINEYGYKLIQEGDTDFGTHYWKLSKHQNTENNTEMKEEYIIENFPTWEDTQQAWQQLTPMIIAGLNKKKYE
jgi:hypothetical protein